MVVGRGGRAAKSSVREAARKREGPVRYMQLGCVCGAHACMRARARSRAWAKQAWEGRRRKAVAEVLAVTSLCAPS